MKRILSLVIVLALCLTFLPANVFAAVTVATGTCGDNLTWTLDDEGTLTISGTGAMTSYFYSSSIPWYSNRSSVKKVVVSEGVTSIGDRAFSGCTGLTSITIPDSVTSIGVYAINVSTSLTYNIYDNGKYLGNNNNPYHVIMDTVSTDITTCRIHEDTKIVGYEAFYNCTGLTSVTIPNGVTSIGYEAFNNCTGMTGITIPDSVTSIDDCAFSRCEKLTSINIPNGVTSIGGSAFSRCSSLTSIAIPDRVTSIGDCAFYNCTSLTSINIPNGVTSIGDEAFWGCRALTSVTIPDSVTSIGVSAFSGCDSLTKVSLGKNINSISEHAFYACDNLTSINIPDGVISIGAAAFSGCTSLPNITIPDSVTSIDYRAFYLCTGLTSVIIGNGVRRISGEAFWGCNALTSITIPDSVFRIDSSAFEGCTYLEEINFNAKAMNDLSFNNYVFNKAGQRGNGITVNIGANVTKIPAYLFNPHDDSSYAPKITTVNFAEGSTCTSIGSCAFYNCTDLTSITIPDSVTSIDSSAFSYSGLISVEIPETMRVIAQSAFHSCTNLKEINLPDGITFIGASAFYNCSSLAEIHIPLGINEIDRWTFASCKSLTSIHIPGNVELIDIKAFMDCSGLTGLTFEEGIIRIDESAFAACANLTSIELPDGLEYIGGYAFSLCSKLSDVTIPSSVKEIYRDAFTGCSVKNVYITDMEAWCKIRFESGANPLGTNLYLNGELITKLVIPENVTKINAYAFYGYKALTALVIPSSVSHIDSYTFYNCTGLKDVYYKGSKEEADKIIISTGNDSLLNATWHYNEILVTDDLQNALDEAAESSATVVLTQDISLHSVVLWEGVTLDLNGHTLTANYLTSYGQVIDGEKGGNGLIVVNKRIHMASENEFLPIYDTAAGGYRFYKYELQNLGFKAVAGNADRLKVGFRLVLSNTDGYSVLANTTDVAIDTFAYLKWNNSAGEFTYEFSDNTLRNFAAQAAADIAAKGSTSKAITLTLTGVTGLGENATISLRPALNTAPGVVANTEVATWNKQ